MLLAHRPTYLASTLTTSIYVGMHFRIRNGYNLAQFLATFLQSAATAIPMRSLVLLPLLFSLALGQDPAIFVNLLIGTTKDGHVFPG